MVLLLLAMHLTKPEKYNSPVFKKDPVDDAYKIQPLPPPSGPYPYHLNLSSIVPDAGSDKMIFHMVGDTGSVRNLDFQRVVVGEMIKHYEVSEQDQPQFLYHLGDIVYNYGEAACYYDQFFAHYDHYPKPIFAIAGNHDSDVNPERPGYKSLDAFVEVFCSRSPHAIDFTRNSSRQSMTQPNIYWTLETPLANMIGLHSNVPKYGAVTKKQKDWFKEELKNAGAQKPGKAIILCVHHAPFSADINHGSSHFMIEFLEEVFAETGVRPDIVFSGHVHNYQRFSKTYFDGSVVPFVVAGSGGFDELHTVAAKSDERFTGESELFKNVELQNYCDDKHGFLKITLEKKKELILLTGEYYSISHDAEVRENSTAVLTDTFTLEL